MAKFKIGDYVRFTPGAELANGRAPEYIIKDPSEWNANSPMLVVAIDEGKGADGQFTLMRESTTIGIFDGRQLKKVPDPVVKPPAPLVPDALP